MLPVLTVRLITVDVAMTFMSVASLWIHWGNVEINPTQCLFEQQASLLISVDYCRYQ